MHQSLLKHHMCVFGWIYRSHARNGNEIQISGRRGSARKIEKLGLLIPVNPKHAWKSWNLAWCHDMTPTCCGNFFGWIGTSFGVSFLQTGASLKKARGSERERVTSVCEKTYILCLQKKFSSQHRTTGVLCQFLWFFRVRLDIFMNWLFNAFM